METIKRKCKVVMLATNELSNKGDICRVTSNVIKISSIDFNLAKKQHLYILSDDEIKEGDWCIYIDNKEVFKTGAISQNMLGKTNTGGIRKDLCKKIIATTDTSLRLPQPSQAFIEKYITEYNKGNVIENVLIEYDFIGEGFLGGIKPSLNTNLKISKDNTITISKVKDSWSREEVSKLLHQAIKAYNYERLDEGSLDLDKWIEENL